MSIKNELALEKFEEKLVRGTEEECWLFPHEAPNGYGVITVKYEGKWYPVYAHRTSYLYHFGVLPDDKHVCHRCDVRLCVNPKHLFLGTDLDNHRDKVKKNRQPRGEQVSTSVLTTEIVKKLRSGELKPSRQLARKLGLSDASHLYRVRLGRLWKHIQ